MLTIIISIISNSKVSLLTLLTFFSINISIYAIFNDQSFIDTLTNDIIILNNWAVCCFSKFNLHISRYKSEYQSPNSILSEISCTQSNMMN